MCRNRNNPIVKNRFIKNNIGPMQDAWTFVFETAEGNIESKTFLAKDRDEKRAIYVSLKQQGCRILNCINGAKAFTPARG